MGTNVSIKDHFPFTSINPEEAEVEEEVHTYYPKTTTSSLLILFDYALL